MKWKAKLIVHRGESRIAMLIESSPEHWNIVRNLEGSCWSQTRKCWHLPDTPENRLLYGIEPEKLRPSPDAILKIESFRRWLRSRRYSESTIRSYTEAVISFMAFFSHKDVGTITNDDVVLYNNEYILARKLSASFQNQIVNALKLFFLIVEEKTIDPALIHRPKRAKVLPNVLSKAEVRQILDAPTNYKHRVMLCMVYACGLRRSELLNLSFTDIHADRKLLTIRQGKGKKDRVVPLSDKVLQMLREYYRICRPKQWLFEGLIPGEPYSSKGIQQIFRSALLRSGLAKPATLHWLRHSYATHLLESGTDLRYIQELLGHNSSRTTEIYTHVSMQSIQNIKSPFDDL